jgi:hypothetical protein
MADAHGSGPCVRKDVGVQLPPRPQLFVQVRRLLPQPIWASEFTTEFNCAQKRAATVMAASLSMPGWTCA